MEVFSNVRFDAEILKEPRGFLRVVQLILSIFAFATVTSVRTHSTVIVKCTRNNVTTHEHVKVEYGYPFRIQGTADVALPFCSSETEERAGIFAGDFSSSAEFFCFVGVVSFLACLILIPAYVFLGSAFAKGTSIAKIDFIGSMIWTLIWLIASAAWADNVTKIALFMDPKNLIKELGSEHCPGSICQPGPPGDHSTLITSVLFGFLNMGLEGAALWFLFKETSWHKDGSPDTNGSAQNDYGQQYTDPGFQTPEYTNNPSMPTTPTSSGARSFGNTVQNDYYHQEPTY